MRRPPTDFAKDRTRKDGLQRHCKHCQGSYRKANRERLAEANKAWKEANPDKVKASRHRRRSRPEVKAQRAAYNQEWKESNPDKVREQARRSYARNAEKRKAAAREAREADPEAHWERCRRWREKNKDKIAEYRRDNRQQDRDYYSQNADAIRERKETRRQWCVYRITFPDECFYIGSSCHHDLRFNAHKSLARKGQHTSALNNRDYGNATLDVLVLCQNEPEALEQEASFIEDAMSKHPEQCLNSTTPTKPSKFYWVYVIQSLKPRIDKKGHPKSGFFYVGMTTDPARRLREHNGLYANGKPGNPNGGKYTAKHRPWEARALYGPYSSRSEALRAEYRLKRQKRGAGRLRWSDQDSHLCRGEGPDHPWVKDPKGWKPPLPGEPE
jgi:predicted GIY-YIG superfamily endonuclease